MGNNSIKGHDAPQLNSEEKTFVENSLKSLTRNEDKLKPEMVSTAWKNLVDPDYLNYSQESLFGKSNGSTSSKSYTELYYVVVKGSLYEKSNYINSKIFGNPPGVEGGITSEQLLSFVSSVVRSYFIVLEHKRTEQFESWLKHNIIAKRNDIDNYSKFLLKDLMNVQPISLDELENWLHYNPLWVDMWKAVVVFLFSQNCSSIPSTAECCPKTLPYCELPLNSNPLRSILDIGKIMFVNDQLPTEFKTKWRLLFSSQMHGESFATFLGKIQLKGPTVIIVEDEQEHIFGGFAPSSWSLNPKFVGNDTAILFKLQPEMQSFSTSGYNDHYQYLNIHQQTMPNGLGMGGQFEYWGLWLDCEYGKGQCSETCTTFKNYKQLSPTKSFDIKNLEVWGVGEEPVEDSDTEPQRSVLDKNLEDRVILDLAGKESHSDGLRDPDLGD